MTHSIILFLVAIVAGAMNAIAGGGSLLAFPIMVATGMPSLVANATLNLFVFPGQLASAYGYRKYLRKVPRQYMLLLIPCAIGAAIGAVILRHTTAASFEHLVPGLILFAVILFAVQPYIHFRLHKHMKSRTKRVTTLVWISIALFPVAVYGGYYGAGFGFIMLAFLGYTSLHDIHKMNALKNLAGVVIALLSIIFLWTSNLIDWHQGLVMAVGGTIGGYYGAVVAQKVSSHSIRVVVIVIGLGSAAFLAFRG